VLDIGAAYPVVGVVYFRADVVVIIRVITHDVAPLSGLITVQIYSNFYSEGRVP
jgi:hypothetical protein